MYATSSYASDLCHMLKNTCAKRQEHSPARMATV